MVHDANRHTAVGSQGEPRGIRAIADDAHDMPGDGTGAFGIEDRRHVRTAAGDEDYQPLHCSRPAFSRLM
jgi:hypothetical protein